MYSSLIENISFLGKKKPVLNFRKNFIIKRKPRNSLWRQITKIRKIKKFHKFENNKFLFFNSKESLIESQLKAKLANFIAHDNTSDIIQNIYQQYIKNNKLNEYAYRHFYNKLSAKIDILKIIDLDRGKNIALVPNIVAKLLSLLTYSVELTSSAKVIGLGAVARHGINEISHGRKVKNAKNKLDHCITDINFIKLLSLCLTKMHELDFSHQERLDIFIDKQFLNFWSLFKKQAKLCSDTENLNRFWSTCLLLYFKELKCPLLKENFDNFLSKITAISSIKEKLACPSEATIADYFLRSKENLNIDIKQENFTVFLPLALQTATMQFYLTHAVLTQLISTANASKSIHSLNTSGFWQNNNTTFHSMPNTLYSKPSPNLIISH